MRRFIHTVLLVNLFELVTVNASLIIWIFYQKTNKNPQGNIYMKYFLSPTMKSINLIGNCLDALTVFFVIRHIHHLKMKAERKNLECCKNCVPGKKMKLQNLHTDLKIKDVYLEEHLAINAEGEGNVPVGKMIES